MSGVLGCVEGAGVHNTRCGFDKPAVIEADHIVKGSKTHKLSEIGYWAAKGGVEAMEREAEKCQNLTSS